jgi:hypothetical protein
MRLSIFGKRFLGTPVWGWGGIHGSGAFVVICMFKGGLFFINKTVHILEVSGSGRLR